MRKEEDHIIFILQKDTSNFVVHEIPPSIYEVSDNNTLNNLVEANVSINLTTMKTQLKTNKVLQIDEKVFFITILGLSLLLDYKPKIDYISRKEVNITTKGKIHLK